MLATASRPRLAPGVRLRFDATRQSWTLLAPERVLMLDEIACEIIKRCDGAADVAAMVTELAQAYSADRTEIEGDVQALLADLVEKRILLV
jgi:pyrroloquinoline quinone biosynthesis protein D